jgi:glycosyltransferase involved in cell wall biosynthesis
MRYRPRLFRRRQEPSAPPSRFAQPPAGAPSSDGGDCRRQTKKKIAFLGLLPPPLDGQRIVTKQMLEHVRRVAPVAPYNLQPRDTRFAPATKLLRAVGSLPLICIRRLAGYQTLYLAPPSGTGILGACVIAALARLLGFTLYAHYHSYVFVARFSWPTAAFLWCCGRDATHIALVPQMADALRRLYGSTIRTMVLSNSAFIELPIVERHFDRRPLQVGHLSNLSSSKGIEIVIECAERFAECGLEVEMVLAGPLEVSARHIVEGALSRLKNLRYVGALARAEARYFYTQIDVFLFPTRHRHEAEPLVILEALAAGVPVVASDRGFIGHVLGNGLGGSIVSIDSFVEQAVEQVSIWAVDREALARASRKAQARLVELQNEARAHLSKLLCSMSTGADGEDDPEPRFPGRLARNSQEQSWT